MDRLLGEPTTCPHGNPIPGTESAIPWSDLKPVADMHAAETATLTRLLEDIELDSDVLRYLQDHELMPGRELTLVDRGPDGTLTLEINGRRVALGQKLARNLWVLPITAS
jgi:DtxR family Mn-dependent transcriptional regulator